MLVHAIHGHVSAKVLVNRAFPKSSDCPFLVSSPNRGGGPKEYKTIKGAISAMNRIVDRCGSIKYAADYEAQIAEVAVLEREALDRPFSL